MEMLLVMALVSVPTEAGMGGMKTTEERSAFQFALETTRSCEAGGAFVSGSAPRGVLMGWG